MLDRHEIQTALTALYTEWLDRSRSLSPDELDIITPPLFLSVTSAYCSAATRILVCGQETRGWHQPFRRRRRGKVEGEDWPFAGDDLWTLGDVLAAAEPVAAMRWGYDRFDFGSGRQNVASSPFWCAFREISQVDGRAAMWTNVARVAHWIEDRGDGESEGKSFLGFDEDLRLRLLEAQRDLLKREIAILRPDACVFFTGPDYDDILDESLYTLERHEIGGLPTREFARLTSPDLPGQAFRTYHPGRLRRAGMWDHVARISDAIGTRVS